MLGSHSIFSIELFGQEIVVLFVMFLNVSGKFLCMGLFKRFDGLVVRLELFQLLLELLHPAVKSTLQLLYLAFEIGDLGLVIPIKLLLFRQQALLVLLELLKALFLFLDVLGL